MVKSVLVLLILAFFQTSFAKPNERVNDRLNTGNTQPLAVPVDQDKQTITQEDVEKIIPTDLKETDDMNRVAARIADRSIQAWFNSSGVQDSALGQTATTVQKRMTASIVVKSDEPRAIEHKFSLQVLALQAMAKVQYSGWLNAVFNYDVRAAESMVEFSEKIFNKDLFVNHTTSSKGDASSVGIKWGW